MPALIKEFTLKSLKDALRQSEIEDGDGEHLDDVGTNILDAFGASRQGPTQSSNDEGVAQCSLCAEDAEVFASPTYCGLETG